MDVVFLDIQIPPSTACCWPRTCTSPVTRPIVFVTAYKEFAVEAFELEAFDYILKPYNEPRLINLLQKLELAGKSQPQGAESGTPQNPHGQPGEGMHHRHPCEQIYYAGSRREADLCLHPYRSLRDDHDPQRVRQPAARRGFFRCHRSYCVNINKIREIVPWFNSTYLIRLHDLPFEVPVSRSNIKAFRQLMRL